MQSCLDYPLPPRPTGWQQTAWSMHHPLVASPADEQRRGLPESLTFITVYLCKLMVERCAKPDFFRPTLFSLMFELACSLVLWHSYRRETHPS